MNDGCKGLARLWLVNGWTYRLLLIDVGFIKEIVVFTHNYSLYLN